MVQTTLWHPVQRQEQLTFLHHIAVIKETVNGSVKLVIVGDLLPHRLEFDVGLSLLVGERGLQVVAEVELVLCLDHGLPSFDMVCKQVCSLHS